MKIGGHEVEITHPDKLLFPDDGITTQDLVDCHRQASPWIVPYLRARPVAMERYPDGIDKPGPEFAGGLDNGDQDGNNGCGNDDDFEDDNEGWCGHKPDTYTNPGTPRLPGHDTP